MRSTIVVGYNRSLPSGRALLEAGREAALRGAEVIVVSCFDPDRESPPEPDAGDDRAMLVTATEAATFGVGVLRHRYPGLAVRWEATVGAPDDVLTRQARQAALLVIGVRGEPGGSGEQQLGPVPELILARTPGPTMVVRGPERHTRGVVLAAIDVAEQAEEVVNFAFAEARFRSALLHAVTSVNTAGLRTLVGSAGSAPEARAAAVAEARAELDRILAERQERCARVQVSTAIGDGPPPVVLAAAAAHAEVVLTGARRRDEERHGVRLGPVTRALLHRTSCPVIVIPHL